MPAADATWGAGVAGCEGLIPLMCHLVDVASAAGIYVCPLSLNEMCKSETKEKTRPCLNQTGAGFSLVCALPFPQVEALNPAQVRTSFSHAHAIKFLRKGKPKETLERVFGQRPGLKF